jgi:hypothetical protein
MLFATPTSAAIWDPTSQGIYPSYDQYGFLRRPLFPNDASILPPGMGLAPPPIFPPLPRVQFPPALTGAEFLIAKDSVQINGTIEAGDYIKFYQATKELKPGDTIWLNSPGGRFDQGLPIAQLIKKNGWNTAVGANAVCTSMCAFIWLAGKPRFSTSQSSIGFHSVYFQGTLQSSPSGNAMMGAYLRDLGFKLDTIRYLTETPPEKMEWLTFEKAKQYDIDVVYIDEATNKQELFQPRMDVQVQVIEDLQLREQPDPRARNILGAPPNDKMPKGSQVAVIDTCLTWMGSGRGAQNADNIWCPVLYEGQRGWANAYYLADRGERVACVMYPTARGCASTAGR